MPEPVSKLEDKRQARADRKQYERWMALQKQLADEDVADAAEIARESVMEAADVMADDLL